MNEDLLWEIVRWQRAKRRAGTAKVKERGEVHGTTKKMYKQKGTGNARHGGATSNVFRGGGQVHGPRPRSYEFSVNKRAVAGALKSALSLRAAADKLIVVADFTVPESRTKNLAGALKALSAPKALLVDVAENTSLVRSSRNLVDANFIDVRGINVYDILRHPHLLMSERSIRTLEARLSGSKSEEASA